MDVQNQPPSPPQPNFTELSHCFENAAREVSRLPNIPAFNQGDLIIKQLQDINKQLQDNTQAIKDLRNEMTSRFDASEANSVARLHNSLIDHVDTRLNPIHDRQNNPVAGFPEDGHALMSLTGHDLTKLLEAFGQPTNGNVTPKRQRFRRSIGIMMTYQE